MGQKADREFCKVALALLRIHDIKNRVAGVLRETLDQLYDGQRTGRYRWIDLHPTEKTHCGSLVEINMQREFQFAGSENLDYKIVGVEVDCKYSMKVGDWMIPPEARGKLCLLLWANDADSKWSMGLVRASNEVLRPGRNRDQKVRIRSGMMSSVLWLFRESELPPNVLLNIPDEDVAHIMTGRSGAERVRRLFRKVQGRRISRTVVATVAQQADYMKRIRGNGGARSDLRNEGIIILGQYEAHREIARQLGLREIPERGESVSVRVCLAEDSSEPGSAMIDGSWWRVAKQEDAEVPAPLLPRIGAN